MKTGELIAKLERLAPPSLALSWDNPGLLCGRSDQEIHKVLIALDADTETVLRAAREGAELILTHHPMIFKPVSRINDLTPLGRKLLLLISGGISCYAMHTNFDIAPGCMADLVCHALGMEKEGPLEPSLLPDGSRADYGVGFVGRLPEAVSVPALAEAVKRRFRLPGLVYYDAEKPVTRAAVCPGSGRGMLQAALSSGADILISGDMGHHDGIDALDAGISLMDAGHFGLEKVFVPFMAEWLRREAPELQLVTEETDLRHFIGENGSDAG